MNNRYFIWFYSVLINCLFSDVTFSQSTEITPDSLPKTYFKDILLLNGENVFIEKYDTTLNGFQVSNLIMKKSFANLYLGNLGNAVKPNMADNDLLPLKLNYGQKQFAVYDFGISPSFIRNKKIFTSLSYSRGTKKEQYFKAEHRQKIAANAMAGLNFAVGASQGFYARQLTGIRNFDIFGMYETRGNRYRVYGKFIYNKINTQENGGLKYDSSLIGVSGADARTLEVRLKDADRLHREWGFYLQHQLYLIKPKVETGDSTKRKNGRDYSLDLTHAFLFNDKAMVFKASTIDSAYFPNIYYDSTTTFDSTHIRSYFNDLKLNLSVKNLVSANHYLDGDFYIGANHQYFELNQRELDTLFRDLSLYAGFQLNLLRMMKLDLKYNSSVISLIKGGRKFEASLKYDVYNDFLYFGLTYTNENKIPELFSMMNVSNHFLWYNGFENISQKGIDLNFDVPWFNFYSYLSYRLIDNFIYFNSYGLPVQYYGTIKNTSFTASQQINYKKFHLINKVLFQKTNNAQLVRFPAFSSYHSLYSEISFFKRALLTQFGIDLRYTSAFFAPYYQPATGEFNLQNETKYGDYIFADVFVNFKVKTAYFFFKIEHINKGWNKKSYILLAHYPMQGRMLKFGVTWNLFD